MAEDDVEAASVEVVVQGEKDALKASHLTAYLEERRDKLAEDETYHFDIHDVAYFFSARGRDIANSPHESGSEQGFQDLARIVEDVRAGIRKLTPQQQRDIIKYLTNDFYKILDRQASDPHTNDPNLAGNLEIFEKLIGAVKEQPTEVEDESKATSSGRVVTEDARMIGKEEGEYEQPPLPDMYRPGDLKAFFNEVEDKKITLATVKTFTDAEITDIEAQRAAHMPLVAAVESASDFLREADNLQEARENGKMIVVVVREGEVVDAGWEQEMRKIEGKKYRFDPSRSGKPPTLDDYASRCQVYQTLLEGVDREGASIGLRRSAELIADPHAKLTQQEWEPIIDALSRHHNQLIKNLLELCKRFDGLTFDQLHHDEVDDKQLRGIITKFLEGDHYSEKEAQIARESLFKGDPDADERFETIVRQRRIIQKLEDQIEKKRKERRVFRGIGKKISETLLKKEG